jgi:NTE family protein
MRLSCFLAAVLLSSAPAAAQQHAEEPKTSTSSADKTSIPKRRLSIGVALEGGGALGLAHIGVLKWFEEHHIPIDYLAGTSMGGLVGGLYATGKSADDLSAIVQTSDWSLLLGGGTPYPALSFRRKQDAREVPNSIQIGLREGATLPPGLNSGHQINLMLDRETLPYAELASFNDLPIPFRCVSTELVSGTAHVFQDGSLSDAMRATISIPGVFAPVRQGNEIFVDGGLVNNLPTDVVRKMGADIVIAVHLQVSPANAKDIQSAFGVLGRSVELILAATELRGMEGADLIVRVNVEDFSTSDYEKSAALIKRGYEAAQEKSQLLSTYSLDDAAWKDYQAQKASRERTKVPTPMFVKVVGTDKDGTTNIEDYLSPFVGKAIRVRELDGILTRLSGTGRYESLTYTFIQENGHDGLLIEVHEKSYAPPLLQPSFVVDGTQTDDVTFTMGARLTFIDVAGYRSEWRTDFTVGQTYSVATELYRPFHPLGRVFFAPYVNASQQTFRIYFKSDPRADYRLDNVLGGMDLGYSFDRFSEIRAGYGVGYLDAYLRLGTPDFEPVNGRVGAFHQKFTLDHTNEAVIPTRGFYLREQFNYFDSYPGASEKFPSLTLLTQYFQPVSERGSIYLIAEGGSTFGKNQTGVPQFFLGGVGRLSAYGLNELEGNQYFLVRPGYLHKIFTLPTFVGRQVYLSGYLEVAKMYGDPLPGVPKLSADGAAGLLAETALGPVFIGGSVGDTGHQKWFFQLGRVF